MSVRRFKAKCRIRRAVLCIVFDGSPSKPAAECRFYDRKKMERWKDGKMESSAIGAELFLFGRDDVRYFRSRKGFYKITSTDAETSSA